MDDTNVTELLHRSGDDSDARDRLLSLLYEALHDRAEHCFRHQSPDHTLQPTALVHEAFLRLVDQDAVDYHGRSHFMAVAALAMKQILIDHARRKGAARHGGQHRRVALEGIDGTEPMSEIELTALDEALRKLHDLDERKCRVVTLRFLGGLGIEQVADVLGVARSTVTEDWRFARAWLIRELRDAAE